MSNNITPLVVAFAFNFVTYLANLLKGGIRVDT